MAHQLASEASGLCIPQVLVGTAPDLVGRRLIVGRLLRLAELLGDACGRSQPTVHGADREGVHAPPLLPQVPAR